MIHITRRRWITALVAAVVLAGALAWPGNWGRLVGWWRGESFWRTRPTSYWRAEMQEWIRLQKTGWSPTLIEQWLIRLRVPIRNPQRELAPIWRMEDDPASVPVLRELALDSDPEVSAHAVTALRVLREDGRPGLPELRAALHHPAPMTRLVAVEGVWDLAPEADELVPVLVELLRHPAQNVRWRVQGNLKNLGRSARTATPALMQAIKDSGWDKGLVGSDELDLIYTLAALGPEGQTAAQPYLMALLQQGVGIGTKPPEEMSKSDQDCWLRWAEQAAHSLGDTGPTAAKAIPLLWQAVQIRRLRVAAARALHCIDAQTQDPLLVEPLEEVAADKNDYMRREAVYVLGQLGPIAKSSLRFLAQILNDKNTRGYYGISRGRSSTLHLTVAEAIWRIDRRADLVLSTIKDEYRGFDGNRPHIHVRQSIIELLAEIGPPAKVMVLDLIPELTEGRGPNTGYARLTDWQDRENSREAVRIFANYRASVANALGAIGPDAKAAVPALLEALRDDSLVVRSAAAAALAKIDPTSKVDSTAIAASPVGPLWARFEFPLIAVAALTLLTIVFCCVRRRRPQRLATPNPPL